MNKQARILNTIAMIRESHSQMVRIYTRGSCLNFFCVLRSIYPEAKPWFNIDHVITEIDGKFYDIRGRMKQSDVKTGRYEPYVSYYDKHGMNRSFKQMYKAEYALYPVHMLTNSAI